jgi:hypothetical protein
MDRVSIGNRRLVNVEEGKMTFCYKDKQFCIDAEDVLRTLLAKVDEGGT